MAKQWKWTNAISKRASLEAAVKEVVEQAHCGLDEPADLAMVFISSAFASEYSRLMPLLREQLKARAIIGCSGGGITGTNSGEATEEIEGEPALSLTVAQLPGVNIQTFHINGQGLPDLDGPPGPWVEMLQVNPAENPQFILLADPFSTAINDLLQGLDYAYPGSPKVGGLASTLGGSPTGLFCNYQLYREGSVGVALSGNIILETIVAQGCRPIGEPYRISEGERNIVIGLEEPNKPIGTSRPPLEVLRELIQTLSEKDRQLAQHSLFVGIARDEFQQTLNQGDFLIRQLLGVDPKAGAIAIGDRVRTGQRIQFHLRDANTSAEDLEMLLQRYQNETDISTPPMGALMFSCLGRGQGLYEQANFDSALFRSYLGNIPLSGFFCNGEIGPVGGTTFLHGYTSVFAICRQP
ncbi:FIST C-terminal domain-containing protein [Ancylothrix sp. C2]|uniref:FIST signal transduction protein n=1 Tax=Ancylothrix sp. D3o TaxID=2953691 RepID=UPI0021BA87AD|nr:FIST N-terminal domain-containing protein [Ancylothrix sp. D3o]MCT7952462.1 FIST C-terminal domain-containing protein [Ancylothrix sp. D3o]